MTHLHSVIKKQSHSTQASSSDSDWGLKKRNELTMATFVSVRLEFQGLLVLNPFKKYILNKICCAVLNLCACVVII